MSSGSASVGRSKRCATTIWKHSPSRIASFACSTAFWCMPRVRAETCSGRRAAVDRGHHRRGRARQRRGHRVEPADRLVVAGAGRPPRSGLGRQIAFATSSAEPVKWSSTTRSVASIMPRSGTCRSSTAARAAVSNRRTMSYARKPTKPAGQRRQVLAGLRRLRRGERRDRRPQHLDRVAVVGTPARRRTEPLARHRRRSVSVATLRTPMKE